MSGGTGFLSHVVDLFIEDSSPDLGILFKKRLLYMASQELDSGTIKVLLSKNTNVNSRIAIGIVGWTTCLHEVVRHIGDPGYDYSTGLTYREVAETPGLGLALDLINNRGANVNALDCHGNNIYHYAARSPGVMTLLLRDQDIAEPQLKLAMNTKNNMGETPNEIRLASHVQRYRKPEEELRKEFRRQLSKRLHIDFPDRCGANCHCL